MPGWIHDAPSDPFFPTCLACWKKYARMTDTLMPSTTGVWYHKADILIRRLIASRTQIKQEIIWDSMVLIFWSVSTLARKPTSILIWQIAGWKIDTLKMYFRLNMWIFQPSMLVCYRVFGAKPLKLLSWSWFPFCISIQLCGTLLPAFLRIWKVWVCGKVQELNLTLSPKNEISKLHPTTKYGHLMGHNNSGNSNYMDANLYSDFGQV